MARAIMLVANGEAKKSGKRVTMSIFMARIALQRPHDDPPRRDFHDKVADGWHEGFAFGSADHVGVCGRHG